MTIADFSTMEHFADHLVSSTWEVTEYAHGTQEVPCERASPGDEISTEQELSLIYDAIAFGIMVWSAPDRISEANRAAQQILGVGLAEMQQYLMERDRLVFMRPDGSPLPQEEWAMAVVFRTGQAQHRILEGYIRPDGKPRWLQLDAAPVRREDGAFTRVAVTLLDVTEHIENAKRILASEERFRVLSEHMSDLVTVISKDGTILYASPSYRHVLGCDPDELQGRHFLDFSVPEDRDDLARHMQARIQQPGLGQVRVYRALHADGSVRIFEGIATNQLDQPAIHGIIINSHDITERVQAETALRKQEQRFRALTEQSNDLVQIVDATGHFQYISPSHRQILGYVPEDLLGTDAFALFHPDDLPRMQSAFAGCLEVSGSLVQAQCRLRRADGSWLTMDGVSHNCFNDPAINGIVITARDVSKRVAIEQALHYQALHDGLTGLPNSTSFIETLEQAVTTGKYEQSSMAVLVLDVDRFQDVNDTFGHQRGDLLLQQVGARLLHVVPESGIVARLSGDEFAILLPAADEVSAREVATAIQGALEEPYIVDGYPVQIDASIGGALFPTHATDALTLLRRSDMATYTAKQAHEGYTLFDAAQEQYNPQRLTLITDLRHAIPAGELRLYYQPKLELKSRLVYSAEALVRWQHPSSGLILPDQFISLAEQTGLITPLTLWVLEEAIRQCGQWMRTGRELSVAVNLSAWNLRDATLPEKIATLLTHYRVPARLLRIELTESAMMSNVDRSLEALTRIVNLGVCIAIDDYGTGYSSLSYLKRLPIDELKIDRSFVQHMSTNKADATIVRSTVDLAHSFGMRTVAEGVEDQATLDLLTELHCDLAQGYFLSRPLPTEDFEHWLDVTTATIS